MSDFDSYAVARASYDSDLPPTSRLVLWALLQHANDRGACWPSAAQLVRATGLSERAVRQHLRHLERAGWTTITETVGRSSTYTLRAGMQEVQGRGAGGAGGGVQEMHPPLQEVQGRGAGDAPTPAPPAPRTTQELQAVAVAAATTTVTGHPDPVPDLSPEEEQEPEGEASPEAPSPASQEDELLAQLVGVSASWVEEGPSRLPRLRRELRQVLNAHGAELAQQAIEDLHAWSEQERIESPPAALRRVVQQRLDARRAPPLPSSPIRRQHRPTPLPAPVAAPAPAAPVAGIASAGAFSAATSSTPTPASPSTRRPSHAEASYDRTARREIYWHDDANDGAGGWVFDDAFIKLDAARVARRANPTTR